MDIPKGSATTSACALHCQWIEGQSRLVGLHLFVLYPPVDPGPATCRWLLLHLVLLLLCCCIKARLLLLFLLQGYSSCCHVLLSGLCSTALTA